jgi:hypothetical protein
MIRLVILSLILGLIAGPGGSMDSGKKKIRVLLTCGGHDFQKAQFFEMFDNLTGIEYTAVKLPDSASILKPGLEKRFDVIVMYDMVESITHGKRKNFLALLRKGIGVVAMHHNLGAHRHWEEYVKIIGGKYLFERDTLAGVIYSPSTYAHDQNITVKVKNKGHPIMNGIFEFQIHDETYKNYYVSPDVDVLLTTDHPQSDPEIAWVTKYGESPVCYLLLGHDSKAWSNPVYPKILQNAILWAGGVL